MIVPLRSDITIYAKIDSGSFNMIGLPFHGLSYDFFFKKKPGAHRVPGV